MNADEVGSWAPVAVASDILDGAVIPARLPSGAIAVWRSASGGLYANGDRCPHRGMRLSHGFVRGETLSCIYHGWRFGTDGACQKIPAHPNVEPPKSINCGPLPVFERNGVVYAASSRPPHEPADLAGLHALRSIVIHAAPQAIRKASGGEPVDGGLSMQLGEQRAILLLSAYGPEEVFVVALVETTLNLSQRRAASTALEGLRRAAEAMEAAA